MLSELEIHRPDLAEKETRVLVIVAGSQPHASELKRPLRLNLEMLMDLDGRVHRCMGAEDQPSFLLYSSRTDLERDLPHTRARRAKSCLTSRKYSAGLTSSIVNVQNAALWNGRTKIHGRSMSGGGVKDDSIETCI